MTISLSREDLTEAKLLAEIEPAVGKLIDRHLSVAKEWFPHDYIPYSLGRDFDKEPWTPDQARLTGVAQTAFEVNLLTEDNLPSYHRLIHQMFSKGDGAWKNWVHRWTAEEGRHAIVIRDYLVVTRNIDPVMLERGRMQTMLLGYERPMGALRGLAYTSFQELATRVSHQNTGKYSEDPVADKIMLRVAQDENLHMVFYRDALAAALEVDPSAVVKAITNEVLTFEMPGAGITGFNRKAAKMADAGIYDLRIHHDDILQPLLRYWKVFDRTDLDPEAEHERERLARFMEKLDASARKFEDRRAARRDREASATE
ncbi:MAG TPA: acyl-ACP desaturase [Candidatus Saccharimonadales bacterium]|nr:acyl-ACP desaturase [Candidatus Saccharimonadales bacterium]